MSSASGKSGLICFDDCCLGALEDVRIAKSPLCQIYSPVCPEVLQLGVNLRLVVLQLPGIYLLDHRFREEHDDR